MSGDQESGELESTVNLDRYRWDDVDNHIAESYKEGNPEARTVANELDSDKYDSSYISGRRSELVEQGILEQRWHGSYTEYNLNLEDQ